MADKKINIDNNKCFCLDDNNVAYKIEKGSANVYIAEFFDGAPKFRKFLKEVFVGDVISGLSDERNNQQYKIFLINTTRNENEEIDKLVISKSKTNDKVKEQFLKDINIIIHENNYQQTLIEHYCLSEVIDARNIYSDYISNENAREDTFKSITSIFSKENNFYDDHNSNPSDLYFALSKVAHNCQVKYIPYQELTTKQRSKLDPYSFAKYSSCFCKKIKLEDEWYKYYIGSFVAYEKGTNKPVACIYLNNKYYILSKDSQTPKKVNKQIALNLEPTAYVLYSTLPESNLDYKDILKFIRSSISVKTIIMILVMGLLVTIIGIIFPIFSQFIYDVLIPNNDYFALFGCVCILFAMIVGTGSISLVKGFASLSVSSKIKYSLQIAFFDRVFKLKQKMIRKYEPADLSMRILGIGSIFTSLTTMTFATIIAFLFSFIYLAQMMSFMPHLVAPAILMLSIIFVVLMIFARIQYKWINDSVEYNIEKSSFLFQIIRGINKLRTSGAENRALKKYMDKHITTSKYNFKINYYSTLISLLGSFLSGFAIIIFYSVVYAQGLVDTVGSLMGFITAYGIFSISIMQIPSCYISYLQAKPWIKKLKPIINEASEKSSLNYTLDNIDGSIDIRHLSFAYSEDSPLILNDISFSIKNGEYVAIVGKSGCGKTTLFNVLLGFEHQNNGKIYYDNHDLDNLNIKELRRNFGVVLQDGDLVSGSILENIIIANPNASIKDVEEVLDKVGLLEEVNNMPMGVHTILSEGSGLISGGQKQRILIARALINKPKILFLDEATSALDNIAQKHICKNLLEIDCTKIVIAHRLSTVYNCDRILVIDEGQIVESGNYESLMKNKGIFYKLSKRQIA